MPIVVPTEPIDDSDLELIQAASQALTERFQVGRHHVAAALRLEDGTIATGLHLGSRRVNLCAEQIALGHIMSHLNSAPVACASVIKMTANDDPTPTSPCGVCREVLGYFYPNMTVVVEDSEQLVRARFGDLLPAPWLLPEERR